MLGLYFWQRCVAGTLSGGSYQAATPIANAEDPDLTLEARTDGLTTGATQFSFDLTSAKSLAAFALPKCNLSANALWRITLGTSAGASDLLNTGWMSAWRFTAPEGMTAAHFPPVYIPGTAVSARYGKVEIDDTANADGYISIPRFICASGSKYRSTHDGFGHGFVDLSGKDAADGGQRWYAERDGYRTDRFTLVLDSAEALELRSLIRLKKMVNEVLYVPIAENLVHAQQYGYLADLSEQNEIEWPYRDLYRMGLKVEERL